MASITQSNGAFAACRRVARITTPIANYVCLLFLTVSLSWAAEKAPPNLDEPFRGSFYTGLGIDTFAADDLQKYLNPEDSGDQRERYVAGVNFAYRLHGHSGKNQLWVFGETVHGLRSTEVDCKATPDIPVCKDFANLVSAGQKTIYILRNASSLEAFAGFKYTFGTAQSGSNSPARVYIKAQVGFISISNGGGDVVDMHDAGLGMETVGGRYEGSYLELGFGRTDLFLVHPKDRWKLDGFLTWHPSYKLFDYLHMSPFLQIFVDSDFGGGADSIQSYIGFDFDLDELFGGPQPDSAKQ